MHQAPRIETKRLILTWPTSTQIDQYYSDIIGTNMFDTIHWDGPKDTSDLPDYWSRCMAADPKVLTEDLSLAIIDKQTDRYIGGTGLRVVDGDPAILDIGYALAPRYHGIGFGTEAVGALVDEAFARRGAERIFANVFVGNDPSKKVAEKLGFKLEGTKRRDSLKRGQWLDVWLLAITRPDWEIRGLSTDASTKMNPLRASRLS